MPELVVDSALEHTVAAQWRAILSGSRSTPRNHWHTKVAYYEAVCCVFTNMEPGERLNWQKVVAAVPKGSNSTFYEVTGRNAKHALLDAYRHDGSPDSLHIALQYQRARAVDQLIDETKVWSYWDIRQAWLASGRPCPDGLLEAVATWARRYPRLAAHSSYAPPACAIEDLVTVGRAAAGASDDLVRPYLGQMAARGAQHRLTMVVQNAVSALSVGDAPADVPNGGGGPQDLAETFYTRSLRERGLAA